MRVSGIMAQRHVKKKSPWTSKMKLRWFSLHSLFTLHSSSSTHSHFSNIESNEHFSLILHLIFSYLSPLSFTLVCFWSVSLLFSCLYFITPTSLACKFHITFGTIKSMGLLTQVYKVKVGILSNRRLRLTSKQKMEMSFCFF